MTHLILANAPTSPVDHDTRTVERSPNGKPPDKTVERLALRLDDVAATIGLSRSVVERERRAGRFPKPDRVVGRMPLWIPATIQAWLEGKRP